MTRVLEESRLRFDNLRKTGEGALAQVSDEQFFALPEPSGETNSIALIVKHIAGQLIKSGRVPNSHRAALGVQVSTVAGPDGQPAGVRLVQVAPGSGAAKAGLQAGDVITAVNGTATPDTETLSTVLAGLQPGQTVPVEVTRASGGTATVQVTLGQLPGR